MAREEGVEGPADNVSRLIDIATGQHAFAAAAAACMQVLSFPQIRSGRA